MACIFSVILPSVILSPLSVILVAAEVGVGACKKKDTTPPSISTHCGSFFICGNIHTIFLWRHGVHSAIGGIGCGRNS